MTFGWPFKEHMAPMAVQMEALRRSEAALKYGYFMEQGLGKSLTLYADWLRLCLQDQVQGLVIWMPNYLKGNWLEQAELVGLDKRVKIYMWPDEEVRKLYDIGPHKNFVLLMNWEALRHTDSRDFVKDILREHRCMLNIDEPSILRRETATSKIVMQLANEYCPIRRITYGTPDPESPMDLYLQLRFLGEMNGWRSFAFRNHFCVMGGFKRKQIVARREENEAELAEIVSRCSFRALKEDWWQDAPEKLYSTREITMESSQRIHYRRMESEFWTFVAEHDEEIEIYADQTIHMLQKLQQISRGFVIDENGRARDLMLPQANPALNLARNVLKETRGKLIVFTTHVHPIDQLAVALAEAHPAILRGGMVAGEIDKERDRFNYDSACGAIIGIEQVMAHGHTLLGQKGAQRCSTTLFYENSFKAEMRMHAEDRNHRFGQDRAVLYLDLVASAQDKRVIKAVQGKTFSMKRLAGLIKEIQARDEIIIQRPAAHGKPRYTPRADARQRAREWLK